MNRLVLFLDATGLAATRLAAILGMSQQRMSALVLGKRMPTPAESRLLDAVDRVLTEVMRSENVPHPETLPQAAPSTNPLSGGAGSGVISGREGQEPFPREWEKLKKALADARFRVQVLERKAAEYARLQNQARVCLAWLKAWAREPLHPVRPWSENYRSSAEDQCRLQLRPHFDELGAATDYEVEVLRLRRLEEGKLAWGLSENPG